MRDEIMRVDGSSQHVIAFLSSQLSSKNGHTNATSRDELTIELVYYEASKARERTPRQLEKPALTDCPT